MSRAVVHESFGGPEVLHLREVPEPHAGPGQVRVQVAAAGLNPMDWMLLSSPQLAETLGYAVPSGFGCDLAGVVDEVGDGVAGFAVGDRVYGGSLDRAVADYAVLDPTIGPLLHTPEAISDEVASTLPVAGLTAHAALSAIDVHAGDTVLIGGAAGGVGVFAVQLARLAGAAVIGTGSETTFGFLRELGAQPVAYGAGLADRVLALVPAGISAATSLVRTETIEVALALGVAPERISAIAAGPHPPGGVHASGGTDAPPEALDRITKAIAAGELRVPIAATFPVERAREAVALQSSGHVHGKVVITL